jgi:hypothetical protein
MVWGTWPPPSLRASERRLDRIAAVLDGAVAAVLGGARVKG